MAKYEHRYKEKQTRPIAFQEFKNRVEKASLNTEKAGFIWLLYHSGCRKSEGYERTVKDCQVTETHFMIDFQQRKKHGATVDPLRFPRSWPEIELLVKLYERAEARRPRSKRIFYQENRATRSRIVKDQWLFPNIQSATAWRIVKAVLGQEYYPHFLRLNRLTEIGQDPEANIVRLKSYSGIKSIRALESYLGISVEEQEAALFWMEKRRQLRDSVR
jgi:hypothetical protein